MSKFKSGNKHPQWKGGRGFHSQGYMRVFTDKGRVLEHRKIIEKALGKPIPPNAISHHVNGLRADNINANLVLCEDRCYHILLHKRERAYKECGHADWLKCCYCGKYDDPENLYIIKSRKNKFIVRHVECHKKYMADYHKRTGK